MKHTIGVLLFTVAAMNASAQDVAVSEVPSVVLNAFQTKFSTATDVDWELENGLYKVEFEVSAKDYDVWLTKDGEIKRQRVDLRKNELPHAIKNKIDSEFNKFRIDDVSR